MIFTIAFLFQILLALATVILAEADKKSETKTSEKPSETPTDIRDKRNLEYSLTLPHSHVASYRQKDATPSPRQNSARLLRRSWSPNVTPPYAVKMEPLPHYSQRDPLYESRYAAFAPPMDQFGEGNHLDAQYFGNSIHVPNNRPQYGEGGHYPHYYEAPEPIIEIIIKESNETLPALPQPVVQQTKKQREPVQVFYVKYQKDAHSKDGVKYDTPIPALTPHPPVEREHYEETTSAPEHIPTLPPPPSTTLRTIIHPDSERFHSNSGIHVSFGNEQKPKILHEEHEESAPEPRVVFPQPQPKVLLPEPTSARVKTPFTAFQKAPLRPVLPPPPPHFIKRQEPLTYQTQNYQHFQQTFDHKTQNLQHFSNRQQLPLPQPPPSFRTPHQFQGPALPNFYNNFGPNRPVPPTGGLSFRPTPPGSFQRFTPPSPLPTHQQLPHQNQRVPFNRPRFNQPLQQQPYHTISQQRLEFEQRQQEQRLKEQREREEFRLAEIRKEQRQHELRQQEAYRTQEARQQELRQIQLREHEQKEREFREQERRQQEQRIRDLQRAHELKVQQDQQQYEQRQREQRLQEQRQHDFRVQEQQRQQQEYRQQQEFASQQQHLNQRPLQPTPSLPFPGPSQQPSIPQVSNHQHQNQQGLEQQHPHIIPAGGELVQSIPKFEQHLSVPSDVPNPLLTHGFPSVQPSEPTQQLSQQSFVQSQSISPHNSNRNIPLSPNQFRHQVQQQFDYNAIKNYNSQSSVLAPTPQAQPVQPLQQQFVTPQRRPQQDAPLFVTPPSKLFNQDSLEQKDNSLSINNFQHQLHRPQLSSNRDTINPVIQLEPRRPVNLNQFDDQSYESYLKHSSLGSHQQSTAPSPVTSRTTKFISSVSRSYSTTERATTSATTTTQKSEPTTSKKPLNIELPDEVPDELRQQLLSSGILDHASISVLDYDKVGDIPIEALPPDQLANFYGAGGAAQIASSNRVQTVVTKEGKKIHDQDEMDADTEAEASEIIKTYSDLKKLHPNKKQKVEMKVVHFDPNTKEGQSLADSYIRKDATYLDPVDINDSKFNKYLPLKVNGAQFPIPDAPELKGRMITSVVVLAPVDADYLQKSDNDDEESGRFERAIQGEEESARYLAGEALKQLVKKPSRENFKRWLDKESGTPLENQAVVLLVTG